MLEGGFQQEWEIRIKECGVEKPLGTQDTDRAPPETGHPEKTAWDKGAVQTDNLSMLCKLIR